MWRSNFYQNTENQNTIIASMDRKSPKNLFQVNQKLFKDMFDSTAIISDHSDHVKAKVDRGVPVQVIKMVIWLIKE